MINKIKYFFENHTPIVSSAYGIKANVIICIFISLLILEAYRQARLIILMEFIFYKNQLEKTYVGSQSITPPAFEELVGDIFISQYAIPLAYSVVAFLIIFIGWRNAHYKGSKSVYTMRRLPQKGEYTRRLLTVPSLYILATVIIIAICVCLNYNYFLELYTGYVPL